MWSIATMLPGDLFSTSAFQVYNLSKESSQLPNNLAIASPLPRNTFVYWTLILYLSCSLLRNSIGRTLGSSFTQSMTFSHTHAFEALCCSFFFFVLAHVCFSK